MSGQKLRELVPGVTDLEENETEFEALPPRPALDDAAQLRPADVRYDARGRRLTKRLVPCAVCGVPGCVFEAWVTDEGVAVAYP